MIVVPDHIVSWDDRDLVADTANFFSFPNSAVSCYNNLLVTTLLAVWNQLAAEPNMRMIRSQASL